MKKMHLISVLALSSIISVPAFAASGAVEGKLGVGSVKAASDKAGFDAGIGYAIRLEKYFAIVPEINFNWLNFSSALGGGSAGVSGLGSGNTISSNFYTIPAFINGRLYIPMGSDDVPIVQPIITIGAGYGWSSYATTQNSVSNQYWLSGFMYQASIGALVNLGMIAEGSASSTSLLIEVGYRGGALSYGGTNFDWGGYTVRAGVSFSM
jgi:hypothetical protein